MASTSTSADDEHRNSSEAIVSSPSTSSSLISCWFNCCCFNLCSNQSHSTPHKSPSTPLVTNDFQANASSTPTNAFQELVPCPSSSPSSSSATYSISVQGKKVPYDVFINHRGPDVKQTIATALYHTLSVMGLRVFLDKEELQLGDYLPSELQGAIQSATLHIAIFSQNYAKSPWCLAELAYMLKTGTPIIPIFYHLQPAQIRYEQGIYGDAFSLHKKKGHYSSEKIEEWKKAVNRVSYYIGEIIDKEDDCGRVLKNVVNRVLTVIKNVPFVVAKYPVGLDKALLDFEKTILQSGEIHHPVQIVGIWGMGGSGKTTLAKQLYNNKYVDMQKSSFLFDIRDADSKSELHKKQQKLVEDLGLRDISIEKNIEEGKGVLASRLKSVRVLIVLADVDNIDQMDALVPDKDSLAEGSLIVVTTRKLDVLKCWGISSIYKIKVLDQVHAQQLFCWHSFLSPLPLSGFENLVEEFIKICDGLPLSLKVFGGQLYGKSSKDYWESQLKKIKRILPGDIITRLQVSYDALDNEEKEAFLDVACFLIGEQKSSAIAAWDGSTGSGLCCWEGLFNKCLVEVDDDECIRMHDHLRDMGKKIADQKSPYRLWSPDQIINVDNAVQGVAIRAIMIKTDESTSEVEHILRCSGDEELIVNTNRGLRTLAPSSVGLKFLKVRGNDYNQVIGDLSRDLVWLQWFDTEQRNLASLKSLKSLRVLELCRSENLEELWESESNAPVQLTELLIDSFEKFQRFPKSIGRLGYLKKIVATETGVESLPDEFCRLQSLEHLNLSWCGALSLLPNNFGDLRNLRHLNLYRCCDLRKLPVSFKELSLLQCLDLEDCYELSLQSDMLETMTQLEYLNLSRCRQMEGLPSHITNQAYLRQLYLEGAERLREIPVNIGQLSKLQNMSIGSPLLESLPTSIGDLSSLTSLEITNCPKLACIPESLGRLNQLKELILRNSGVRSFAIVVRETSISEDCCPGLEMLNLGRNECLTEIDVQSTKMKSMVLRDCGMVRQIRGIDGFVNIQTLIISGCPELESLPSFAQLACLKQFELVKGCYGVKRIEGLEHCRALEEVRVHTRWEEAGIQSLERMERLRKVSLKAIRRAGVEGCIQNIRRWPERVEIWTRAVPDAASLLNSYDFSNLTVVDSIADKKISSFAPNSTFLKWPSSANCIVVCLVVNCESQKYLLCLDRNGRAPSTDYVELEDGKWVFTRIITQHSKIPNNNNPLHIQLSVEIILPFGNPKVEVEKGLVVTGEEERVMEAFAHLWAVLSA